MKNLFCLLFIIFSINSFSQSDSLILKKNINIGGNFTQGNFNFYSLNIKPELTAENKKNQLSFNPSFQYSQIKNNNQIFQLRERELYSSINYTKRFNEWRIILSNETEQSYLRKVDLRGSIGLGVGHKLVKTNNIEIDLSQMILPEYLISNFGTQFNSFSIRYSTRFKLIYKKNNLKFSLITFIQPSLYTVKSEGQIIDFQDNINARSNANIEYSLQKWISIGISNQIIYQTYSASINKSIKPLDNTVNFFLKINR